MEIAMVGDTIVPLQEAMVSGNDRSCYRTVLHQKPPDPWRCADPGLLRRKIKRQLSAKRPLPLASAEAAARTGHDLAISKHPAIGSNMRIAAQRPAGEIFPSPTTRCGPGKIVA